MDKKHNNLAQPETDWKIRKKKNDTSSVDPTDHTGVKMKNEPQQVNPK